MFFSRKLSWFQIRRMKKEGEKYEVTEEKVIRTKEGKEISFLFMKKKQKE